MCMHAKPWVCVSISHHKNEKDSALNVYCTLHGMISHSRQPWRCRRERRNHFYTSNRTDSSQTSVLHFDHVKATTDSGWPDNVLHLVSLYPVHPADLEENSQASQDWAGDPVPAVATQMEGLERM